MNRSYKVDNAVIMAAGTSSRFAPLSYEKPKALITVKGEVLIERQIRQLQEAGIPEIYIVVGYKAEAFAYLEEKFGVHLILNSEYNTRNNNASIFVARNVIRNSYICSADNYFTENPFTAEVPGGAYYAAVYADGPTKEWCMTCDADDRITGVEIGGENAWYMLGHTFWDEEFSKTFMEILLEIYDKPETKDLLWESIYLQYLDKLNMKICRYADDQIFEFDTLDELRLFDTTFVADTTSAILKQVAKELHCTEADITEVLAYKSASNEADGFCFRVNGVSYRYSYAEQLLTTAENIVMSDVKKIEELCRKVLGTSVFSSVSRMGGLTNHTYHVTLMDGKSYVVRIPGEGTEEMIVRRDEMTSTKLACDLGVDARLLYFGEDGSKVTEYIPNAVTMSAQTLREPLRIRQMAEIYRTIHHCGADTKVPFEVFDMARGYEKIIADKKVEMFADYREIKARVMEIKAEIDKQIPAKKVPCHNDPLCENWVVGNDRMYLIDWEYAGMNDGMWDVADVSIEAGFGSEEDALLLTAYLDREPSQLDRKHFLASKIYVDYLWSLWAKARVPYDGQPMEDWAVERYTRMKSFIQAYEQV